MCIPQGKYLYKITNVKNTSSNKKGFTLVEIIVAIAIFIVLVTISMGAIAGIFDANRKSQSLKAIMTNLNFAVEIMAREIRFGSKYHCGTTGDWSLPQDCSSGDNIITFESSSGGEITYRLNGNTLEKSEDGGNTYLGITAPEINIESMKFFVTGAELSSKQPKVLILIRGHAGNKPTIQSSFTIQTTVSQRILDS